MNQETQESVQDDTTADAVAEETSSPEVTEGVSSSDTAAEEPKLQDLFERDAEEAVKEFKEEHGDPTEDDGEDTPEANAEVTASDAERKTETEAETDDGDDEYRLSDSDFKALPDGARKRIGHLNARAKKAERQLADLEGQVREGRDAQQRLGQLRTFVEQNQMSHEDVSIALGAVAKLRTGDYEGFLKEVGPMVQMARQAAGQEFAPDLQDQVDNGYLSDEAARELTKARLQAQRQQEANQRLQQQHQQLTQQQQHAQTVTQIVNAVNAREQELRQSDPDYAQKAPAVKKFMEFAMQNGARPTSVEQAVKLVNDAYANASETMPKPAPKATPPRPSASSVSRGNPAPRSLEEAFAMSPPPQS